MQEEEIQPGWWKWGEEHKRKSLTDYPHFLNHIEERWGKSLKKKFLTPGMRELQHNETSAVGIRNIFAARLPALQVSTALFARLKRSVGKSYPDLLNAATCKKIILVDAVLFPVSHEEVVEILKICTEHKILVIPFGGGSNVVGALSVKRQAEKLTVSVDMSSMKNLISLDLNHQVAVFQAGILGPALEKLLNEKGFTLGHFPQSFEYSTLGGWIATRSAGQESSTYGKIEDMVISLKVAVPAGTITTSDFERDAEGINIKSLFFGSEGSLGIVTEVKVIIHPLPESRQWLSALFPEFETGLTAVKELIQSGMFPSVLRYSDEQETFLLSLMSSEKRGFAALKSAILKRYLNSKQLHKPCLFLARIDGSKEEIKMRHSNAKLILKKHKGLLTGEHPGVKWEAGRFGLPYLVDDLIERDILVDTVETVLPWDKLNKVKTLVNHTLLSCEAFNKEKGILLSHVSHVYRSAASIYFTFITERNSDPHQQWNIIKSKVLDIVTANGGAVSHHHSIGTDLQKWYVEKTDPITKLLFRKIKNELDPAHILNPGKLLDE